MFDTIVSSYILTFKKISPSGDIFSKDYNTTIIRNIMIYFLYKHYKKKQISRKEIQDYFSIKHINSLYSKINHVEQNIENRQFLFNKKRVFEHFYFVFLKNYIKISRYGTNATYTAN